MKGNSHNFTMAAKTLYGFEDLLAKELVKLGALNVRKGNRVVFFDGDTGFMYKANLSLRTALKILKPIENFSLHHEDDLYRHVNDIPWEKYLIDNGTLAVYATVNSKIFTHSKYVALKTKDAIVDRFRSRTGSRPDVDTRSPDLRIDVHLTNKNCTISLDTSGESLHKRGYRTQTTAAPLSEVLAAGLIMLSGWEGSSDFLDPMCGSGTILQEAAMIGANIPPNIHRKDFAFQRWPDWDESLYDVVLQSRLNKIRDFSGKIVGYDKSPSAVTKAEINRSNANLDEFITVERRDFFRCKKEGSKRLHILFNPPYGERLKVDAEAFYQRIGDTLKQGFPNSEAWLICANPEALKSVGLKTSKKIKVYNGPLESRLVCYEMYEGSLR